MYGYQIPLWRPRKSAAGSGTARKGRAREGARCPRHMECAFGQPRFQPPIFGFRAPSGCPLTRALLGARPSGALRASKSAPADLSFGSFGFAPVRAQTLRARFARPSLFPTNLSLGKQDKFAGSEFGPPAAGPKDKTQGLASGLPRPAGAHGRAPWTGGRSRKRSPARVLQKELARGARPAFKQVGRDSGLLFLLLGPLPYCRSESTLAFLHGVTAQTNHPAGGPAGTAAETSGNLPIGRVYRFG
jgi:hypothetical protein